MKDRFEPEVIFKTPSDEEFEEYKKFMDKFLKESEKVVNKMKKLTQDYREVKDNLGQIEEIRDSLIRDSLWDMQKRHEE